jgi:carbon monoxide dehydrogenase subunit G
MQMTGRRHLAATREQAWQCLNDPEVLRACLPGCDRFEPQAGAGDAPRYDVGMRVKVGPVSARFAGRVSLSMLQPPESYQLAFEGQGGAAGFGSGTSAVRLIETEGGGCDLDYEVTAAVGGKLAQIGQRLIDAAARAMADDFFRRFEGELLTRYPAATPGAAAPEASGLATHATDSAKGAANASAATAAAGAPSPAPAHAPWRTAAWWAAAAAVLALVAWALARSGP